jgi:hypothetical protein
MTTVTGASDVDALQTWFTHQGVPRFGPRYSLTDRVPILMALLVAVLAYHLGVAPWLQPGFWQLAISPLILIFLTLWVMVAIRAATAPGITTPQVVRTITWRLAVFIGLGFLVVQAGDLPPLYTNPWADFAVLIAGCAAAVLLWLVDWERVGWRWRLLVSGYLVLVVLAFAMEGSIFEPFAHMVDEAGLGLDTRFATPVALPAFPVALLLLLASILLVRMKPDRDSRSDPAGVAFAMGTSVLAIVFSLETAVLPHMSQSTAVDTVCPLVVTAAVVAIAFGLARRPETPTIRTGSGPIRELHNSHWVQAFYLLLFVFAYPLIAYGWIGIEFRGDDLAPGDAFFVALAINLAYLVLVGLIVANGLDRVGEWAVRELRRHRSAVVAGMARGLPMLLGFAALYILSGEIWQVMATISGGAFVGLIGILMLLTLAFAIITSRQEISNHSHFDTWEEVYEAAAPGGAARSSKDHAVAEMIEQLKDEGPTGTPGRCPLGFAQWTNALSVLTVYQGFILVPVAVATAALFMVLGRLLVPSGVAAEWVYGDGTDPNRGQALLDRPFFQEPWTRVALILAAFSVVYYAVQVLSNRDQYFFKGADEALRRRFAARLASIELEERKKRARAVALAG